MRTEKEVLDLRARVDSAQRAILDKAATENRTMNAEENAQWEKADVEFKALTAELNMIRAMQERETPEDAPVVPIQASRENPADAKSKKATYDRWAHQLIKGPAIPREQAMAMVNTERASTSSSGDGLYVMPEEFISMLEVKMKQFGGMFQACYIHRSRTGNPMRWPTYDGTSQTGQWVSQPRSADIVPRGLTFDRNSFNAHTWYDIIGMDWEFIQDEEVGLVASKVAEFIGEAAGRAMNWQFTKGNGSGVPTGILDASGGASTGKTTSSNSAITKTELIDTVHSVDPAYRTGPNVAWMFNDNTLAAIRKLDLGVSDTVPIWQPAFREGDPDRILGYRYFINQDFPAIAASQKIAAFGDWSKYVIRQVRDVNVVRLDETFAALMQTAFLGWLRVDGKFIQPSAIKLLVMTS